MPYVQRIYGLIRTFRSAHNGSVAIYFALSFFAIMGLVGLVFDYGRAMNVKAMLGAAADAAALATARDPDIDSNNLQQRAEAFFLANTQNSAFGTSFTVNAQELVDGEGVHVDITAQIDTTMLPLFGVNHFTIAAESEAVYSTSKIELALVLDNTGSMGNGGKIQTLRSASDNMIDLLLPDGPASENVKIGIVPFDVGVNVGVENSSAVWMKNTNNNWGGCVGARKPTHDVRDSNATGAKRFHPIYADQTSCNIASILPLTNNKTLLHDKISNMQAVGWTYIPEGLAWGWRVLSRKTPFQEGVGYSDTDWSKVLVLMTDGANTVNWTWDNWNPTVHTNQSSSSGNSKTATLCNKIKDKGIIIYTVAFQVNSNSTRQMLEDCATTPGNYFDAQNNASLEAAFSKISGDINNLRLSK